MPQHTDCSISTELTQCTSGGIRRVYIPSQPFVAAKMIVLGLIPSSSTYMRSAKARFPLQSMIVLEISPTNKMLGNINIFLSVFMVSCVLYYPLITAMKCQCPYQQIHAKPWSALQTQSYLTDSFGNSVTLCSPYSFTASPSPYGLRWGFQS